MRVSRVLAVLFVMPVGHEETLLSLSLNDFSISLRVDQVSSHSLSFLFH